jgi:diguanylate cyclase (GGDEF)-like protein
MSGEFLKGELHPLLARQISEIDPDVLQTVAPLLERINATYTEADEQRLLLERTMEISSRELRSRFKEINELAEIRLAYERDRFQAVFEGVTAGLIIVNENGQVAAANPEATRVLGPLHALLGTQLDQLLRVRTNQQVTRPLIDFQALRDSPMQQRWQFTNVVISPTEALPFPADCVVVPFRPGQSRAGAVVFIIDNTARETSLADLQWQATHDTLTGLSNRLLLLDRLQHALVLAERSATWPALLFLDLDRFKAVNDRYGHSAGDRLLVETARRIETAVRPADTVVRLGGDEFVVLCEALDHADVAEQVAERVLAALGEPFEIDGNVVSVSASIGIIHAHGTGLIASDVIRDADLAMYRAKENGRGRIETFDRDLRHETRRRVVIERALRGAIDNGELTIAYQPIFATRTGHLVAFEALARWNDPELGVVPSNEFISLAEETGLIVPLGLQQLDIACRDALNWATASHRPIGLHVNVSARQLAGSMLLSNLQHAIREFDLPPHCLTIEIPESVLIENPDRALERLRAIRELGVSIAIDDFGTGKASLAFLRHLPLDIVKIDRALVGEMSKSKKDLQVMRSIVDLATGLNFSVIAEGVEQAVDLGALRSIGCEFAQGFLLGSPMTSQNALDLARRWATPTRDQLEELPSGIRLPSSKMSA